MADMPVDKPSPSDIKRNLTPREARQLVELQYHEQLRQYQRWLVALAEAARERRRAEEEPHSQQDDQTKEVETSPLLGQSSILSVLQGGPVSSSSSSAEGSGNAPAGVDEKEAKKRRVDPESGKASVPKSRGVEEG